MDVGLQKEDPTIAELLKPLGYATGQFGKNHLGDLNKYLPTAHGFDEFFGNLYHLNAEEEPEHADYPTEAEAPLLRRALLPRGVIHSLGDRRGLRRSRRPVRSGWQAAHRGHRAADQEADGDHRRRNHRRLCRFHQAPARCGHAVLRVDEHDPHAFPDAHQAGKPRPGRPLAVAVPRHDDRPRPQRRAVARSRSTSWGSPRTRSSSTAPTTARTPTVGPTARPTPFRSEKNTNWEGAFRIPEMIRWPGKIKAGVGVQRDCPAP